MTNKVSKRLIMFFSLLKNAFSIDIFDLNYIYGSEKIGFLRSSQDSLPRSGIVVRIGSFIWYFLHTFKQLRVKIHKKCVVFFFTSGNQRDALLPVVKLMGEEAFSVGIDLSGKLDLKRAERFPAFFIYLLSLPFLPLVFFKFWMSQGYKKRSFSYALDSYWLIYGTYLTARLWLRSLKVTAVVVSNDHSSINRTFIKAAIDEGITTFYIQHASVTEDFPPLFFDYALLEGSDALQKYESAGLSNTIIYLIGTPKFDNYLQYVNLSTTVHSIGVCINQLDPANHVDELCGYLQKELPCSSFYFRPHPSEKRDALWLNLCQKYCMQLSNSRTEHPFEFLKRVDVIIAGDSNILLEAALMNVVPIYYDFLLKHLDHYGFLHKGLVSYTSDPQTLCNKIKKMIENKPQIRPKAKAYCATVGTNYDGSSSELAARLIRSLLSSDLSGLERWTRIRDTKLKAYELIDKENKSNRVS